MAPPVHDGVIEDLAARCRAASSLADVAGALVDAARAIAPERAPGVLVRVSPAGQWQLLAGALERSSEIASAFQHARRQLERQPVTVETRGAHHRPLAFGGSPLGGCLTLVGEDTQALAPVERSLLDGAVEVASAELDRIAASLRATAAEAWHATLAAVPRLALAADPLAAGPEILVDAVSTAVPGATAHLRLLDTTTGRLVPIGGAADRGRPAEQRAAQTAFDLDRLVVDTPPAAAVIPAAARQVAAAPLRDAGGRRVGVLSLDMPLRGLVLIEEDVRDLPVVADLLALILDMLQTRRALRILERVDPETGCFDGERLVESLAASLGDGPQVAQVALLLVQVDRETDAHDPALAQEIARRLVALPTIERKRVFRLGTWRFAVVCDGAQRAAAMQLASRMRLLLRHGLDTPDTTACVGVAVSPRHARDAQGLLVAAGAALDAARRSGPDSDSSADDPAAAVLRSTSTGADVERRRALQTLAGAVDDAHFGGAPHAEAVADRVRGLCLRLGVDRESTEAAVLAGQLHDLGRAVMPRALFEQRGLKPQELQAVLNHVVLGSRLLDVCGFRDAGLIVRRMHEKWDGTGFPEGLAGEAIPIGARILAVANAFETVLNDLGRGDGGLGSAVATVRARRSSAFDPAVVDALLALVGRSGPIARAS